MKKYIKSIGLLLLGLILVESCMCTKKTNKTTATIGFIGDVMIGRLVNEVIDQKGYAYPWGNTLPLLNSVDLRIINLEAALTVHKEKNPKVFNFKALPNRVKILKAAHIDVVNLANNHSLDYKNEGLLETIKTLDDEHINHVGAGKDIKQAKQPVIITKNNIKIGIIGYTDNEPTWIAQEEKPGTHYIHVGDIETVQKDIAALRPFVDIIIATIHWGPNMQTEPSQSFVEFAHKMIDSGIDIIHGHSAHIFQPIEIYKKKLILYDTGDFIDDYAIDPVLRNDQSFFFAVTINKSGPVSVTLTPVIINNMQVNEATSPERERIIQRIQKISLPFNASIGGNGTIHIP